MPKKAWGLFALALLTTAVVVHPYATILVILSWVYSVIRFSRATVRIDPWWLSVGSRSAPLVGLDLRTVGRARNPWPWKVFSKRYLGANPIWTEDSVRIVGRGADGARVLVAIGTNRRDEFLAVLHEAVSRAYGAAAPSPFTDPLAGSPAPGSAGAGWNGAGGEVAGPPAAWVQQSPGQAMPGLQVPANAAEAPGRPLVGAPPGLAHPHPAANAGGMQGGPFQPAPGWGAAPAAPPRPPGWYDDPWAPGASWRWWDGTRWTTNCAPAFGRGPYG